MTPHDIFSFFNRFSAVENTMINYSLIHIAYFFMALGIILFTLSRR